jgi:hypothetical protein
MLSRHYALDIKQSGHYDLGTKGGAWGSRCNALCPWFSGGKALTAGPSPAWQPRSKSFVQLRCIQMSARGWIIAKKTLLFRKLCWTSHTRLEREIALGELPKLHCDFQPRLLQREKKTLGNAHSFRGEKPIAQCLNKIRMKPNAKSHLSVNLKIGEQEYFDI